jgi:hypothetical protein
MVIKIGKLKGSFNKSWWQLYTEKMVVAVFMELNSLGIAGSGKI